MLTPHKIDAALIARQADAVEKNKGAKLDMFSKTLVPIHDHQVDLVNSILPIAQRCRPNMMQELRGH